MNELLGRLVSVFVPARDDQLLVAAARVDIAVAEAALHEGDLGISAELVTKTLHRRLDGRVSNGPALTRVDHDLRR